jgi:hypothetical protein
MIELSKLDAGSHFSSQFKGWITLFHCDWLGEKVASFQELLEFIVAKNLTVIWDLKQPHPSHPHFLSFIQTVINIIRDTAANSHVCQWYYSQLTWIQVIWLLSASSNSRPSHSLHDEIAIVKAQLPEARIAISAKSNNRRPTPDFVRNSGIFSKDNCNIKASILLTVTIL